MDKKYYLAINGQQAGPYSLEEIKMQGITPETLIWRSGLGEWTKAGSLSEVADVLFVQAPEPSVQVPPVMEVPVETVEAAEWYAMLNGEHQIGPHTVAELIKAGINRDTPVWRQGMPSWENASTQSEIMEVMYTAGQQPSHHGNHGAYNENPPYNPKPDFSANPAYGRREENNYGSQQPNYSNNPQQGGYYGNNQPYRNQGSYNNNQQYGNQQYGNQQYGNQPYGNGYGNNYNRNQYTNWLPWAIGATVVGFLFSCIGVIFGIIGIVQANKANNFYSAGDVPQGNAANSSAKTMTIIAFVLGGIGLLISIIWLGSVGALFSALSGAYY